MTPYYEHGGITIYRADYRDVLPLLGVVDLVLTDPPYGIRHDPTRYRRWDGSPSVHTAVQGDDAFFDLPLVRSAGRDAIIWGGNYWAHLLPAGGWLVWDKRCSDAADRMFGHSIEIAWCSQPMLEIRRLLHGGLVNVDSVKGLADPRFHPTQKPVALMMWCLSQFSGATTTIDPFMGSGSTLLAAKSMQRTAIGIEIEEKYCEIAAKRLQQETLPLSVEERDNEPTQQLVDVRGTTGME